MTDLPIELARHYREEADRVRKLAADAALPGVREALLNVVREYDQLADNVGGASDHWARADRLAPTQRARATWRGDGIEADK